MGVFLAIDVPLNYAKGKKLTAAAANDVEQVKCQAGRAASRVTSDLCMVFSCNTVRYV